MKSDTGERLRWGEPKVTGGGGSSRRLTGGDERASPYKALPRGRTVTVSRVENIRRREKSRVVGPPSWRHLRRCDFVIVVGSVIGRYESQLPKLHRNHAKRNAEILMRANTIERSIDRPIDQSQLLHESNIVSWLE